MIKPNELRIGNRLRPRRVIDPENTPIIGYAICAAHIAYSEEYLNNDWEPIPLTPEILKKCGFVKHASHSLILKVNEQLFLYHDQFEKLIRISFYETSFTYPIHLKEPGYHFQHLHQLQNLFHSITGKELEIKL